MPRKATAKNVLAFPEILPQVKSAKAKRARKEETPVEEALRKIGGNKGRKGDWASLDQLVMNNGGADATLYLNVTGDDAAAKFGINDGDWIVLHLRPGVMEELVMVYQDGVYFPKKQSEIHSGDRHRACVLLHPAATLLTSRRRAMITR